MADSENKNVSDSLGSDAVHKDGTDYIKDQLDGKGATSNAHATEPAAASESTPATKPEPIVAQPPASNPGAEDPTAGIAKGAGGVSSAAHVESPTTAPKEKRKSIVGQLTGFLGFGGKKDKEAKNAGEDNSVAAYASSAAATTAATTAVLTDRTKATVQDTTGIDLGAKKEQTADTDASATAGNAEDVKDPAKQTSSDPRTTEATTTEADTPSGKDQKDTSGEDADKPPKQAGDPKTMENRQAIPVAGGEKLGEKHWGESKIVPDNPKPKTEETGVSSSEGQPSKEVSENTAKNTGGASGGPSGSASPEGGEKKEKFMDKMKDKLKIGKKDKA